MLRTVLCMRVCVRAIWDVDGNGMIYEIKLSMSMGMIDMDGYDGCDGHI